MILLFKPCLKCLSPELTCRGNDACISYISCHQKWERVHLYYHDFHGAEPETDGQGRL